MTDQLRASLEVRDQELREPLAKSGSGVGVEAPIVGVDPTAISVALPAGGPVVRDLVISNENTEPSELDYRLSFATTQTPFGAAQISLAQGLGEGGIREVEFVVQAFQLIRGGRDARLVHASR